MYISPIKYIQNKYIAYPITILSEKEALFWGKDSLKYYIRFGLAVTALVVVFIAMSQILPPSSFGQFGWYRGDSVQEIMDLPLKHVGADRCLECHEPVNIRWESSIHSEVSCESCHGVADEHVKTNSSLGFVVPLDQLCTLCHAESISRPEGFSQIKLEEHWTNITINTIENNVDSTCTVCHETKSPTVTGEMVPHLIEDLSDCSSCHGLEGIKPFSEPHVLRPNEVCSACHSQDVSVQIPEILHSLEELPNCSSCHGVDAFLQFPLDHSERTDDLCIICHEVKKQ